MKEKVKIASLLFANTQISIELIDRLKGTGLYNQSLKNLYNKTQAVNIKTIDGLYKLLNEESEPYFNKMAQMMEDLMYLIEEKDLEVMCAVMSELRNGNVRVVEDNKHKKMLDKFEKI